MTVLVTSENRTNDSTCHFENRMNNILAASEKKFEIASAYSFRKYNE
jgi:hypothetical protein